MLSRARKIFVKNRTRQFVFHLFTSYNRAELLLGQLKIVSRGRGDMSSKEDCCVSEHVGLLYAYDKHSSSLEVFQLYASAQ